MRIVEYAFKKARNSCSYLRALAWIGWSGPALKHSGDIQVFDLHSGQFQTARDYDH